MDIIKLNEKVFRKVTEPRFTPNTYFISEDGELYNMVTSNILKGALDKDGYRRYTVNGPNGKSITVGAHRLVAMEFNPNPNNYPVVDHIDGVKLSNHYTNLEWVTIKENTHRAEQLGLRKIQGSDNGNSKYTEDFIRLICRYYESGSSVMEVLRLLKGDNTAQHMDDPNLYAILYNLKKRKIWTNVVKDYTFDDSMSNNKLFKADKDYSIFNEDDIHKICQLFEKNYTSQDVLEVMIGSRDYTMNKKIYSCISDIRRRKTWKYISDKYEFGNSGPRIEDSEFYQLASEGYTLKDMKKLYGIRKREGHEKIIRKMERAIKKYERISKIPKKTDITIEI